MTPDRPVSVHSSDLSRSPSPETLISIVHRLDQWPDRAVPPGELSIALLTAGELAQIHADFLDDPSETDVITFPGDDPDDPATPPEDDERFAGEICISLDRATNGPLPFDEELTLYLVHGWLHLSGLGDQTPAEAVEMRAAESAALAWLNQSHL